MIIPAWCEAKVIGAVVREVRALFPRVLVVDDGSTDETGFEAQRSGAAVIRHAVNLGQGAAIRTGIEAALREPDAEWLVTFDADGQHRPEDASAMLDFAVAHDLDAVFGTRFFEGAALETSLTRKWLLRLAVHYTRATTGLPVTDAHNGLRILHRRFAGRLVIKERGMGHASEMTRAAAKLGAQWAEFPVHIHYTDYSRTKGQSTMNSVNIMFDSLFR